MEIRVLGSHTMVSADTGYSSLLFDGALAVDAGSLTSALTFEEQKKLKAILLTHLHNDHIRDIPSIGWNFFKMRQSLDIYAPAPMLEALTAYINNELVSQDLTKIPENKPTFRMKKMEPGKAETICGFEVLPVPVLHTTPTTGYQITSPDGKKVFVTSDTGPGLAKVWKQIKPDILIIETTFTNREEATAIESGHLTSALVQKELVSFYAIHNYFPEVIAVHISPLRKKEIRNEIRAVEKALKIKITVSREGMTVKV